VFSEISEIKKLKRRINMSLITIFSKRIDRICTWKVNGTIEMLDGEIDGFSCL